VTPFTHDQPDNADRVRRLGVGAVLPASKYAADGIVTRLRWLTRSPAVARNCLAVKRRFEGVDPIGQTCDLIESLGSQGTA
jgi:UDP:flavonoid glycosyltransferase YjiC (YdhE family)